eukprot:2439817-Pleurochrysis_carterae.AAC.1
MRARASHFVATDSRKSARYITSSGVYINLADPLPGNRVRIRPEVRIYCAQILGLPFKHEQHGRRLRAIAKRRLHACTFS